MMVDLAPIFDGPPDWPKRQLREVVKERREYGRPNLPLLSVSSRQGVRLRAGERDEGLRATGDLEAYLVVHPGDLAVNKLVARSGAFGVSAHHGIVSPAYYCFAPDTQQVDPRYLDYALHSEPGIGEIWRRSKDLPPNAFDISREKFGKIPIPLPSLDTQRRIADMLDAETARIDTLIAKNERMLALLDRRETSLITRAVMGESGLGSDADPFPMVALRYRTRGIQAGVDFASSDLSMDAADGLVRYVRTTDIASISSLTDAAVYAPVNEVPDSAMARDGDLLVTRAGSLGTAYVHRGAPVAVAGYLVRIQFDRSSDSGFYGYWCRSRPFLDALEVGATQTTIQNFSASKYASMPTPAPALETQRRVVSLLDAEMSKMDALRSAVDRQQELLRLRRQALITAAVTGQIEV